MPINALVDFIHLIFQPLENLGEAEPLAEVHTVDDLLEVLRSCVERLPDANLRSLGNMHLRDLRHVLEQRR